MAIIGLTGNFGMGKSTVLELFRKLGAHTYSADDYVRRILNNQTIIRKINDILGGNVLIHTGQIISLNKEHIADIIFNDPRKRKAVEDTIHPEVLKAFKHAVSDVIRRQPSAIIVFEVPLLFEAGYEEYFDKTIVVHCRQNIALDRLVEKGYSKDKALKRIQAQMPITAKKKRADFSINNNNGMTDTAAQVSEIFKRLTLSGL